MKASIVFLCQGALALLRDKAWSLPRGNWLYGDIQGYWEKKGGRKGGGDPCLTHSLQCL